MNLISQLDTMTLPPFPDSSGLGCGLSLDREPMDPLAKGEGAYVFGVAKTAAERKAVYAFRYQVYAEKMGRPNISDADHRQKIITDALDDSGCHFWVKHEGRIVGAIRAHRIRGFGDGHPFGEDAREHYGMEPFLAASPDGVAFSSRLIIDPDHRNGPVLNLLLAETYKAGLKNGIRFGFVQCSPSLVELYERLGYRRYGENIVDPVFGFKVPMVLVLFDQDYLAEIRSPLIRILRNHPRGDAPHPIVKWFDREFGFAVSDAHARRDRNSALWQSILGGLDERKKDGVPLLEGLSSDDVSRLTRDGTLLRCKPGDTLIREDGYGNSMFLVLAGGAKMTLQGSDEILAEYLPGDVFGEISLVAGTPRSTNVTITQDSEIFVFTRDHLDRLMKTAPELAAKVLLNISQTLGQRLIEATHGLKRKTA